MRAVPKGTILMSFKLTVGRLAVAGCDLYTNEAIVSIVPTSAICGPYLRHFLGKMDFAGSTDQAVKGATLNKGKLASLDVVLPPIAEQRAIGAVLDAIDDAIAQSERAIAATEGLRRAMLHELLTRGLPGWHTEWKHVPSVGTMPSCWHVTELAGVATVTSGATPKAAEPRYYEAGTIPFVRINDVTRADGPIDSTELRITSAALAETAVKLYPADTVLLTMYGTIGSVARTAKPMTANQAIAAFLQPRLRPAFLEHLLRRHGTLLARLAGTTTQANISGELVKRYKVAIPVQPREADAIIDILESVSGLQSCQRATVTALHAVKGTIADSLLSGRLRLWGAVGAVAVR